MSRRLSSILPLVLAASLGLAPAAGAAHLACNSEARAGLEIQPGGLAQRAGLEIQPGGIVQRAGVEIQPNGFAQRAGLEIQPGGIAWQAGLEIQPGGLLSGVEVEPNG